MSGSLCPRGHQKASATPHFGRRTIGAYRLSSQEPHPHPYPCPDPLSPAAPERFILQIWVTAPAVTDNDGDYQNDSAFLRSTLDMLWGEQDHHAQVVLFMVLLLPSLGLSNLDPFFCWLFDKKFLAKAATWFVFSCRTVVLSS